METLVAWLLALAVPYVLLIAAVMTLGRSSYRARTQQNYDFLTLFPFEFVEGNDGRARTVSILFPCLGGIDALTSGYLLFTLPSGQGVPPFLMVFFLLSILKNIAFALLFFIPAYRFKPHIFIFVAFAGLSLLSLVMECIVFSNRTEGVVGVPWVFLGLIGVLGLAEFALLLNPKLTQWTQLSATMQEDGAVVTSRPRPFPLAFTEWALIAINGIAGLLGLIGSSLISILSL